IATTGPRTAAAPETAEPTDRRAILARAGTGIRAVETTAMAGHRATPARRRRLRHRPCRHRPRRHRLHRRRRRRRGTAMGIATTAPGMGAAPGTAEPTDLRAIRAATGAATRATVTTATAAPRGTLVRLRLRHRHRHPLRHRRRHLPTLDRRAALRLETRVRAAMAIRATATTAMAVHKGTPADRRR